MSKSSVKRMDSDVATAEPESIDWVSVRKRVEEPLIRFTPGATGAEAYKDRQQVRTLLHRFRQMMKSIEEEVAAGREERERRRQRDEEEKGSKEDLQWLKAQESETRKNVELATETTISLTRAEDASATQKLWRRIIASSVGSTYLFAAISAFNGKPIYFGASGAIGAVGSVLLMRRSATPSKE